LLNIKRLAYELTPVVPRADTKEGREAITPGSMPVKPALPRVAPSPAPTGIAGASLARRIDEFLASRGYAARDDLAGAGDAPRDTAPGGTSTASSGAVEAPRDFVCEDDVRQAIKQGRKIVLAERSIVTPAARELGEEKKVFRR